MNAHTPGPWTAKRTPEDGALPWAVMTNDGLYVATPHTDLSRSTELEANARLIAAAPDLLEALRFALSAESGFACPTSTETKLRAAIKKAEGQ